MGIYFIIAGRNLIQARRRSLLLGFALATVTMLLVLLLSWSNGIADTMIRSATALSSGHVNVSGFYKTTATDAAPMVTNAKVLREAVEELAEDVEYIVTRQRGWSRIVSDLGSVQSAIGGLDIETDRRFLDVVKLAAESEYKENGREIVVGDIMDLKKKNHVLLFVKQAKRLRVEPGDKITVTIETMSGMTNSVDLTVAAVGREVGLLSGWNIIGSVGQDLSQWERLLIFNYVGGGYQVTGQLAEVTIFSATLSTSDRQKMEGYYAWKYALTANLPAGHPYKNVAP